MESKLLTSRYDAILLSWANQIVKPNLSPSFGSSKYTPGSPAETARTSLINEDGWSITDGGAFHTEFIMTVATTAPSESFTIPCRNEGTFNAIVDWGDGSTSPITAYNSANLAHVYASAGDHVIIVSGMFPNIYFANAGDKLKVKSVSNLGIVGWLTLYRAFYGCSNMTIFSAGNTDTSNVTNMSYMFNACSKLTTLDVSNFDTSNVTNMSYMFYACSKLTTLDVSNFDTSNVTNMESMFFQCSNLTTIDVSNFDTSNVTNMQQMFFQCSKLTTLDVSNFDTSNVTNMYRMFFGCYSLTTIDVSNFDTRNVTNMMFMFAYCSSLTDVQVDLFDISNVTNLSLFMLGDTLLTSRYDAILTSWANQIVKPNLAPSFGSSKYSAGSPAETARASLINEDGWSITDGGGV